MWACHMGDGAVKRSLAYSVILIISLLAMKSFNANVLKCKESFKCICVIVYSLVTYMYMSLYSHDFIKDLHVAKYKLWFCECVFSRCSCNNSIVPR